MTRADEDMAQTEVSSITHRWRPGGVSLVAALAMLLGMSPAASAQAGLGFSKSFAPDTIGPGSTTTLTFDLDNSGSPTPVTDIAFTDLLPAAITIATPAGATNTCGGTLAAPDGGGTIALTDGAVGAFSTCTVVVNVTSGTPGLHTNLTGDLTSSAGNSGTATDGLTVTDTLPGFTKAFAPSTVPFGGRSTLTFTIDNAASASGVANLGFTDNLPPGMVVANPALASTDCEHPLLPATVTAVPGTGVVSLDAPGNVLFLALDAGSTCTVQVDVIGGAIGTLGNLTEPLLVDFNAHGRATAVLTVTGGTAAGLLITKSFVGDPVAPGLPVELEFTITNGDRNFAATSVAFTDDLDATLGGLTATLPPTPDPPCGAGSSLSFSTGVLSLSDGNLAPEASCIFRVAVMVPAAAARGAYPNTTSAVTGDIDGSGVTGNVATDTLFVEHFPILTKAFTDDPVGGGDTVTLEFTITNTSAASTLSGIAFLDELTDTSGYPGAPPGFVLPFPVPVNLPPTPDPPCGIGSSLALAFIDTERQGLELSGGSLAAAGDMGDSCTFSVTLDIPVGFPGNTYTNTTREISAVLDDVAGTPTVVGPPARDDLVVSSAPTLTKEFTDDPVDPGDPVTLEFTLSHDALAPGDATAVGFTDDLTTLSPAIAGLAAAGGQLPLADLCGPGNGSLTGSAGDTLLTFSGATLTPGQVCTFSVTLSVPAGAAIGSHTNTTSDVTATVQGVTATGTAATDDLQIATLTLVKEFTDDPVIAGGTANLRFTLVNPSAVDATGVFFVDSLADILPGTPDVTATFLPMTPCGGTISGTTTLVVTGGVVLAGTSCVFDVTVLVPVGTADGTYSNATSNVTSSLGVGGPAYDSLIVESGLLQLTKEFADSVAPGDTVNLHFTLTNFFAGAASDVGFFDDLDTTLTGLVATGLPFAACGGTVAAIPDAGTIDFSGGSLAAADSPGDSCSFDVTLAIPGMAALGTYTNTTSDVAGTVGGLAVSGAPASDDLLVAAFSFTDDPLVPGVTPVRAVHFTELRTHIDTLRISYGLGAYSWTPPAPSPGLPVRAVDLTDLRRAIDDVLVAAGTGARMWETDPAVVAAAGTPIRAQDLVLLRDLVKSTPLGP